MLFLGCCRQDESWKVWAAPGCPHLGLAWSETQCVVSWLGVPWLGQAASLTRPHAGAAPWPLHPVWGLQVPSAPVEAPNSHSPLNSLCLSLDVELTMGLAIFSAVASPHVLVHLCCGARQLSTPRSGSTLALYLCRGPGLCRNCLPWRCQKNIVLCSCLFWQDSSLLPPDAGFSYCCWEPKQPGHLSLDFLYHNISEL